MTINCTICSLAIDATSITFGDDSLHAQCLSGGLLQHALLAAVEIIAVVTAPVIIVWGG